jgi:acyl-CoA dehydrogenase
MSVPFQNGPTVGHDVFVPLDHIIGGPEMAGHGWRMLMECLSAGRSLSLPADAVGGAQLATRVAGAYASIREQFGLPIGRFEGVAAPLGRIAGTTYWMNALREVTAGAVDAGERPGVISSIAKCWSTEAMRRIANDAMDIAGGAGICKGPRNVLAPIYESVPIGITVEGANILTRSLIVFGQGAVRCHPWALAELGAAQANDIPAFDRALAGHASFALGNATRAFVHAVSGGVLADVYATGKARGALRQVARLSAAFATITDAAMLALGGGLKRAEAFTGRMADALAWMYIASATANRYMAAGNADDDVLFDWAIVEATSQARNALAAALDDLPVRWMAVLLRVVVFPFGAQVRPPSDRLAIAAGRTLQGGNPVRARLTRDMFVPARHELGLGRLEHALELAVATAPLHDRLREAQRAGTLDRGDDSEILDAAIDKHVLTADEAHLLREAIELREDALRVDDYGARQYDRDRERVPEPVHAGSLDDQRTTWPH